VAVKRTGGECKLGKNRQEAKENKLTEHVNLRGEGSELVILDALGGGLSTPWTRRKDGEKRA